MQTERFASSPVGRLTPISGTDGRTGRPYSHHAFVPDPLDGNPDLSGETWAVLAKASFGLGRLNQASRQIPAPDLLRRPSFRREAQSTSALEGTFAPIDDVLAADLFEESPVTVELMEVLNYVRAAERGFTALADGYPLNVSLLCELHRTLVSGTRADGDQAGRVRAVQVAIGGGGGGVEDARFVPPPPGLPLEADVRQLMDWVDLDPHPAQHPIIAAAMAHYQFETLHPFNDGNGRIGRLLIAMQLVRSGLINEPLLTVSPWFEARRDQYIDHLAAVSATGDWDPWVRFFATGIHDSALDTTRRVDELLDTQESYLQIARENNLRGVARDIVDLLIGFPITTVPQLVKKTSASFPTVNTALQKLVKLGILVQAGGNPRRFIAPQVLRAVS